MEKISPIKMLTLICMLALVILFYLGEDLDGMQLPRPAQFNMMEVVSEPSSYRNESEIEIAESEMMIPIRTISDSEMKLKKILIWHYAYGGNVMGYGYGRAPFIYDGCEENRCYLTDDKNLLPVTDFDAVMFHLRSLHGVKLPMQRLPYQRWIFFEMESASYIFDDPKLFNNLFNWTMTYRKDSDIPSPYGYVEKLEPNAIPADKPIYNKTKMAAWFVSNCKTMSFRENIVKQLQQKIQVDIYGKCGHLSCQPSQSKECYKMIEKNYKFYLSFENSFCKDYVTEKLYNILRHRIVPIVYGNVNYDEIAPPHSVIDVRGYNTSAELADYLLYLDGNETAYNEYFEWKQEYRIIYGRERMANVYCNLCKKLHTDKTPKVYEKMDEWFVGKGKCKRFLPLSPLERFFGAQIMG